MASQIIVVGLDGAGKTSLIKGIKYQGLAEDQPDEEVYKVQFNGSKFEFYDNVEQAGANAIVYCIDGSNLDQLVANKEGLDQVQRSEVPIVIVQTKADVQTIDQQELKEFLKPRADIQIVNVSAATGEGLQELQQILQSFMSNLHSKKLSFEFEAEPRVVKSRGKYKINETQTVSKSEQTFLNLMKDKVFQLYSKQKTKRVKLLDPTQQEQEYVRLEKERIKVENMHNQLTFFKKNKKKMTPYEIKASANPRISVNLAFFLVDSANTIENTISTVDTQTDTFHNPPPSPKYIPKKTGIDAATQVEDYELFDFDREVTPILDVICTKTLEQACLEIEQEEEIKEMKRFKDAFYKKREQEKEKQAQVVQNELNEINRKNKVLKEYMEKEQSNIHLLRKLQAHAIAGQYLKGIAQNAIHDVVSTGFYPDEFQNELQTKFVDWLVSKTLDEAKKIVEVRKTIEGAFDTENLTPIYQSRTKPDQIIQKKKKIQMRRNINQSTEGRAIRIVYWDEKQYPTALAVRLPKFIDGTLEEFDKAYDARVTELEQKLDAEQIPEEEFIQTKRAEFPDVPQGYLGSLLNYYPISGIGGNSFQRFAFTLAHNQFYQSRQSDWKLQPFALIIERSGKWTLIDETNLREGKTVKLKNTFRQKKIKQSEDQAIINVAVILFGLRLPNLQQNIQPPGLEALQHSRFGVYDSHSYIPYDQTDIMKTFKFEDLTKAQENPDFAESPQTSVLLCYALTKRFKQLGYWNLEAIKSASKGLLDDEMAPFYEKLGSYATEQYESTLQMDKDLIERFLEKEKELDGNPLSLDERSLIQTKLRLPPPKIVEQRQMDTIKSQDQSVHDIQQRNLDQPQDNPKSLNISRIFNSLQIPLQQQFDDAEQQIIKHLQISEPALIESFLYGFELRAFNKPFLRVKQLIRMRTIGDLVIVRKPEPIPEKTEEQPENLDGDGNQPQDDDS